MQQWAVKHNFSRDAYNRDGLFFLDVVLTAPLPHAVLITSSVWATYAVPLRDADGRKIKFLEIVKPLVEAIGAVDNISGDAMADAPLGPDDFVQMADNMRHLLSFVSNHAILLRAESTHFIRRLELIRKNLLAQQFAAKQRCFAIEHLLQCVWLSGFLKRAEYTKEVVMRALTIAIQDKGQLNHLRQVIDGDGFLPSPSTILRNRLTVHLGYCRWKQKQLLVLITDPSGIVGFGTFDLSPRIGHEWLLSLRTDIIVANLSIAVGLALELGTGSIDRDKEIDIELRGNCMLFSLLRLTFSP